MVTQTKERSRWSARRTLRALGVSAASYYRWRRAAALRAGEGLFGPPPSRPRPTPPYEATPAERQAVRAYALKHPAIRHRELAWRMVDEDVAYMSPSTVYRILKQENLVCPWRRREKRNRPEDEKAQRPNQRWGTDLMYLPVGRRMMYLVTFLDEYSRYLVHWELLSNMEGGTLALAAKAALETLPRGAEGSLPTLPEIRTDNGSGYISREFREVLREHRLTHRRIKPHCPEENGLVERSNRTLREALEGEELSDRYQAEQVLTRIVRWYNEERLHRALGYLRPVDYYCGDPERLHEVRRCKLVQARHRRKEENLQLRQRTLLLDMSEETGKRPSITLRPDPQPIVAYPERKLSQLR